MQLGPKCVSVILVKSVTYTIYSFKGKKRRQQKLILLTLSPLFLFLKHFRKSFHHIRDIDFLRTDFGAPAASDTR